MSRNRQVRPILARPAVLCLLLLAVLWLMLRSCGDDHRSAGAGTDRVELMSLSALGGCGPGVPGPRTEVSVLDYSAGDGVDVSVHCFAASAELVQRLITTGAPEDSAGFPQLVVVQILSQFRACWAEAGPLRPDMKMTCG